MYLMILGLSLLLGGQEGEGTEEPALERELDGVGVLVPLRHPPPCAGGEGGGVSQLVAGGDLLDKEAEDNPCDGISQTIFGRIRHGTLQKLVEIKYLCICTKGEGSRGLEFSLWFEFTKIIFLNDEHLSHSPLIVSSRGCGVDHNTGDFK